MKKEYIEPRMRMLILDQEDLMDFVPSPTPVDDDDPEFDFSKEGNTFGDESLPQMKSVWDEEF